MLAKTAKGFPLIELLIGVAIIGIIAAIAIPNLLNAIQRGKQKRTMGDMRTLATANETYAIDNNQYVVGTTNVAGIATNLEPTFVKKIPRNDGWSTAIQYDGSSQLYTITSYGKDKGPAGGGNVATNGGTTDFGNDIVFSLGSFIQFPEGSQK